jgi:hypothetical protein
MTLASESAHVRTVCALGHHVRVSVRAGASPIVPIVPRGGHLVLFEQLTTSVNLLAAFLDPVRHGANGTAPRPSA